MGIEGTPYTYEQLPRLSRISCWHGPELIGARFTVTRVSRSTIATNKHTDLVDRPISTQVYSLFDDNLPKPTVKGSKFRLPDCYNVTNVQPIETKTPSFNEETLFWIFYSCPADIKQQMAAQEL